MPGSMMFALYITSAKSAEATCFNRPTVSSSGRAIFVITRKPTECIHASLSRSEQDDHLATVPHRLLGSPQPPRGSTPPSRSRLDAPTQYGPSTVRPFAEWRHYLPKTGTISLFHRSFHAS